jgi:hypothetical protein
MEMTCRVSWSRQNGVWRRQIKTRFQSMSKLESLGVVIALPVAPPLGFANVLPRIKVGGAGPGRLRDHQAIEHQKPE